MNDVYGAKAPDENEPTPEDQTDHDLATPHFVSWSARRESGALLQSIGANWPEDEDLIARADRAHELLVEIDERIAAKS